MSDSTVNFQRLTDAQQKLYSAYIMVSGHQMQLGFDATASFIRNIVLAGIKVN